MLTDTPLIPLNAKSHNMCSSLC